MKIWTTALTLLLIAFFSTAIFAEEDGTSDTPIPEETLEEIKVTASRLTSLYLPISEIPLSVDVVGREDIEDSAAYDIGGLIFRRPGVIFYDQTGNGRENVLSMRGFSTGRNLACYLDGIRINEPEDNTFNLSLIPLNLIERAEIFRGSSSHIAGDGSAAGTLRLFTGIPDEGKRVRTLMGFDSHGTARLQVGKEYRNKKFYVLEKSGYEDGRSFRRSTAFRRKYTMGKFGVLCDGLLREFEVLLLKVDADLEQAGALTAGELDADRETNIFNRADYRAFDGDIARIGAKLAFGDGDFFSDEATVDVYLYERNNRVSALLGGRSFFLWGGWSATADYATHGGGLEMSLPFEREGSARFVLTFGCERSESDIKIGGWMTDVGGARMYPGMTDRETGRRSTGLWVSNTLTLFECASISAAWRHDEVKMDFDDRLDPTNDGDGLFRDEYFKLGAAWEFLRSQRPDFVLGAFANYSDGFRIPDSTELFAYSQGVFATSNRFLDEEKSTTREAGVRGNIADRIDFSASYYDILTRDEIQFVPTGTFFGSTLGQNRNVGRVSRRGFEASCRAELWRRLEFGAAYDRTEAEYRKGVFPRGNSVPAVPSYKAAFDVTYTFCDWLEAEFDLLHVGKQALINDGAGARKKLGSYAVADFIVRAKAEGMSGFVKVANLFDTGYETRGVFSAGTDYFTPADGRNVRIGVSYEREF